MREAVWTFVVVALTSISAFYVVPEQATVTYINKKYLKYGLMEVKRYSRRSGWFVNIAGETIHTWGNNVSIHYKFFEFLHNEYRPSFIDVTLRVCDLVNKEPYIGGMLKKTGLVCPVPPREYKFLNMTMNTEGFNNVWPFEKGRMEGEIFLTDTGESVAKGYCLALFKMEKEKKHSNNTSVAAFTHLK